MKWTEEAEKEIRKAPFFVRKKIRSRVEKEAEKEGKSHVGIEDVLMTRKRFLAGMDKDIRGFKLEKCFAEGGCPNSISMEVDLFPKIERILKDADLLNFLKEEVKGPLRFHHEFQISIAQCPNACSRPQIKDIGIIAASSPAVGDKECIECGLCEPACPDQAIQAGEKGVEIDHKMCMECGKCIRVCPSGTIYEDNQGFKVMLGGKLGRHPRLARSLGRLYSEDEVLRIVSAAVKFYKRKSRGGKRFAEILTPEDFSLFASSFK